jgi:hypothetical protein
VVATTAAQGTELFEVVGHPEWSALDDAQQADCLVEDLATKEVAALIDELAAQRRRHQYRPLGGSFDSLAGPRTSADWLR